MMRSVMFCEAGGRRWVGLEVGGGNKLKLKLSSLLDDSFEPAMGRASRQFFRIRVKQFPSFTIRDRSRYFAISREILCSTSFITLTARRFFRIFE
jgi:hypothetical protein